jgi:hypothetical protein
MALDGIMFEGVSVRVRRPNDYNPATAAALGPGAPNPALNLAAIGLGSAKTGGGVGGDTSSRTGVQCIVVVAVAAAAQSRPSHPSLKGL